MATTMLRLQEPSAPPRKPFRGKTSRSRSSSRPTAEKSGRRSNPDGRRDPISPKVDLNPRVSDVCETSSRSPVMEEVRILKRGEALRPFHPSSSAKIESDDLVPCSTKRPGAEPPVKLRPSLDFMLAYSGPAFMSSPSPSSLPIPAFLKKAAARGEDVASNSLRCLVRLDGGL